MAEVKGFLQAIAMDGDIDADTINIIAPDIFVQVTKKENMHKFYFHTFVNMQSNTVTIWYCKEFENNTYFNVLLLGHGGFIKML